MNRFLLKLIPFLIFPAIIIVTNYLRDPANLFNANYELGIANYLAKGYNVTNVVNYNGRKLQKDIIGKMLVPPSVIALGSSRIMQLHKTDINDSGFINNGMAGATFEDALAIYELYEKKGYNVKKVIFELDPWMLNDNNEQTRWKTLENEYKDFVNKLYGDSVIADQPLITEEYKNYAELVSLSYFKTSLEYLVKGISKKYTPTKQEMNSGFTYLCDGSITYESKYRNASVEEVNAKANGTISTVPVYSLGDFDKLSMRSEDLFIRFIGYLKRKNVEIEFFLTPFHPIVYNYFEKNEKYHNVFAAENYFKNIAEKNGIKVYGSYNPKVFNFDVTYFYDGLHCNGKAIRKILERPVN